MELTKKLLLLCLLCFAIAGTASAQNLLHNPCTQLPAADVAFGSSTTLTGIFQGGGSAAADWALWNNTDATTISQLVSLPNGGAGLQIITNGAFNGVYQGFAGNIGPSMTFVYAYVNVGSGPVTLLNVSNRNGAQYVTAVNSSAVGAWELMSFPSAIDPVNEITIYSATAAGASFYVGCVFNIPVTYEAVIAATVEYVPQANIAGALCAKLRAAQRSSRFADARNIASVIKAYQIQLGALSGKSIDPVKATVLSRVAGGLIPH